MHAATPRNTRHFDSRVHGTVFATSAGMAHPEVERMDRVYQYRLRAELESMADMRFRARYQSQPARICRGVRTLPEFRTLSDDAILSVAKEYNLT